jgi:hypothetical protein
MARYAGDPRWTRARSPGNYRSCGGPIARGERVFYWPRQRGVSCAVCGEVEARASSSRRQTRSSTEAGMAERGAADRGAPTNVHRRRIERLVADCDPRHVEALMRLDFGTLDRLCGERFRCEARRAAAAYGRTRGSPSAPRGAWGCELAGERWQARRPVGGAGRCAPWAADGARP